MRNWIACVSEIDPVRVQGPIEGSLEAAEAALRAVPGVALLGSQVLEDPARVFITFCGPTRSMARALRSFPLRPAPAAASPAADTEGPAIVHRLSPLGHTNPWDIVRASEELAAEVGGLSGILWTAVPAFPVHLRIEIEGPRADAAHLIARTLAAPPKVVASAPLPSLQSPREGARGRLHLMILDPIRFTIHGLLAQARAEAAKLGCRAARCEVAGFIPRAAIDASLREMLELPADGSAWILEEALERSGLADFAGRLAAATPSPGGGAAAARAALHASALLSMVSGITAGRLKGEAIAGAAAGLEAIRAASLEIGARLRLLEEEDAEAFENYLDESRLARREASREAREALRLASIRITEIPLALIGSARRILGLLEALLDLAREQKIPLKAGGDLGAALELSQAAARISSLNVRSNLPSLPAEDRARLEAQHRTLISELEAHAARLRSRLEKEVPLG